jgi:hypothetical protein
MDVFSMKLGIRLSVVKTSEFGGGGKPPKPPLRYATERLYPIIEEINGKCL